MGIGIGDNSNLLPLDYFYHRRLNTIRYNQEILRRLQNAPQTNQGITCALEQAGKDILGGLFDF